MYERAYQLQLLRLARYVSAAEKAFYFLALNEMYPVARRARTIGARGELLSLPRMKNKFTAALVRVAIFGTPLYATADRSVGPSRSDVPGSASDHGEYLRRRKRNDIPPPLPLPEVTILEETRIRERRRTRASRNRRDRESLRDFSQERSPLAATFRVCLMRQKENGTH